jgi:16S rRNA processing protein RimM
MIPLLKQKPENTDKDHGTMGLMSYKNRVLFGRIIKIHGYDGTVIVKTEPGLIESIPELESVFIEIDETPVPFFISTMEYSGGDTVRIKFHDYDSDDKMAEFIGCKIFIASTGKEANHIKDYDIIGFRILEANKNFLGTIINIIHNPGQDLISVQAEGKKPILIPLHKDFILDLDRKSRTIIMDLPEGLTEVN